MKTILENSFLRYLAITLLCFSLVMVTGCSGCKDKDDDKTAKKEEEKKKKKKKPPYETRTAVILPGYFPKPKTDKQKEEEKENPLAAAMNQLNRPSTTKNKTKLGHWVTTNFQAVANNFNADGQLTAYSQTGNSRPVPIPATDYFISTSRPVSLPKGEWKNFETTVFLPPREIRVAAANINYQINRSSSGLAQIQTVDGAPIMKPHQFHMLLLSNRPDSYSFFEFADSIRLRGSTLDGRNLDEFYVIVPTIPGDPLPLPRHALNWTTIAYMIWDDYDPQLLEPDHQQAILDWIHFGGQIIVSGPDALDKLQNSFLAEFLPAHFERSRNLTNIDVEELNKNWTVPLKRNPAEKRTLQISEAVPLLGVDFKPHDDSRFVDGTGEMAIERKIGRGRIVVTAFSLNAAPIRKWRSYKSFINGVLLRKPRRNFGPVVNDSEVIIFEWADDGAELYDPLLGSTQRYLARDLSRDGTPRQSTVNKNVISDEIQEQPIFVGRMENSVLRLQQPRAKQERNLADTWHYGGFEDAPQSGTSGWNDRSGVALAARNTLREAAGIRPPSSKFVLKMLAAYLVVLVPLNWLIFRMIGRVEYAWAAAPIIAIVGAFLVIKFASLDIGFVRSNTQVGLLEIQADYPRGHLAEYSALYTSLSTRYNADLDNLTAQSMPFAIEDNPANFDREESLSQVQLRRTNKNRIEGLQIQSNTTGLVHTEYLLDLQGVLSFVPPSQSESLVSNSTNVNIEHAGVVGCDENGEYQIAWIGDLPADSNASLKFESKTKEELDDAWLGIPSFRNSGRTSSAIWTKNMIEAKSAMVSQIREFPELQTNWPAYQRLFLRGNSDEAQPITQSQFERIYQEVNSDSDVGIGRMFDKVIQNLAIAPGEYRLIGSTAERLGKTAFEPESTQIDQQTLVVVHLKHAPLPLARRDLNSLEEFKTARSSIDWEDEAMKRDQLNEDGDQDGIDN